MMSDHAFDEHRHFVDTAEFQDARVWVPPPAFKAPPTNGTDTHTPIIIPKQENDQDHSDNNSYAFCMTPKNMEDTSQSLDYSQITCICEVSSFFFISNNFNQNRHFNAFLKLEHKRFSFKQVLSGDASIWRV